jgi:hypothetical protein
MDHQFVKCKETLILIKYLGLGIWSWHPKLFLFVIEPAKVMNYFVWWLLIKVLILFLVPIYNAQLSSFACIIIIIMIL